MDPRKLQELREFVRLCQSNPAILQCAELGFFTEWLQSMGASIPSPPPKESPTETNRTSFVFFTMKMRRATDSFEGVQSPQTNRRAHGVSPPCILSWDKMPDSALTTLRY
ncbi:unnamed protein product [Ranitomeya imitator]|uniref:Hsp70-interacting protein N-terminal domain-containing protein n=1 Tax=Ranitomeya imitator TaxID=111125 RepID=A0ABN9LV80_9NEOB|nr:unnamed protein product [Ranitomeya imitator]